MYYKQASDASDAGIFRGVPLLNNTREREINVQQFYQGLTDNMTARLFSEEDKRVKGLVTMVTYKYQGLFSPEVGVQELCDLCTKFKLSYSDTKQGYRDFKDRKLSAKQALAMILDNSSSSESSDSETTTDYADVTGGKTVQSLLITTVPGDENLYSQEPKCMTDENALKLTCNSEAEPAHVLMSPAMPEVNCHEQNLRCKTDNDAVNLASLYSYAEATTLLLTSPAPGEDTEYDLQQQLQCMTYSDAVELTCFGTEIDLSSLATMSTSSSAPLEAHEECMHPGNGEFKSMANLILNF